MNRRVGYLILCICLLSLAACGPRYRTIINQENNSVQDEYIKASIIPAYNRFNQLAGFIMNLENKTDKSMEIIWEKTWYIQNGETRYNFIFSDASSAEPEKPKPYSIIFATTPMMVDQDSVYWNYYVPPESLPAKTTIKRFIFPITLVSMNQTLGLLNDPLPEGDNGVLLTIKTNEKDVTQKMFISVKKEPVS
ncbi:MAG: hypothetical protein HQK55_15920 [Deltaproteobacteria bacterium]|nr:hypothetical protein [Deltaproteobacteria bacterium]